MKHAITTTAQNELETDVAVGPDGRARVILRGRLNAQTVVDCSSHLEHDLIVANVKSLQVDASGLLYCDGAGFALLRYMNMRNMTPGATVSVVGLEAGLEKVFRGFTLADYEASRSQPRIKSGSFPERIGGVVSQMAKGFCEQMAFLGAIVACLPASLHHPKRSRWLETTRIL